MTDTETDDTHGARRTRGAPKKPEAPGRRGVLTGGLALILAAIALIGSAYLWYELLYKHEALFRTDIAGSVKGIEKDNRELRESLASLEEDLALIRENQDTIRTALDKVQNDLSRNRIEWALTETERLLLIANHRLQLARDTGSALSALRAADRQLALIANPNLVPIRREIAREIGVLEALEKTDVTGLALRLASLADTVERLPLSGPARPAPPAPASAAADKARESWRETARDLWSDLLSLVRIRHDGEARVPLLPPEQQYFLRENLRLAFYGAKLAILHGNGTIYRQNLLNARRWLKEHFDGQASAVSAALTEVEKLLEVKLAAELPDISASLEALRRLPGRSAAP
jgi:uncharacterized protein HemX